MCFFPPPIERIIIENTNRDGRVKFNDKWTDIDEDTYCCTHSCRSISVCAFLFYLLTFIKIVNGSEKNEDVHGVFDASFGRPIFRSIMSEATFHMITSALRFDNVSTRRQSRSSDKFAPICGLWERWQLLFPMLDNCYKTVTEDEKFVGFRERYSFRQLMPSKPAKYGLKF